jgi:hypothetical protein
MNPNNLQVCAEVRPELMLEAGRPVSCARPESRRIPSHPRNRTRSCPISRARIVHRSREKRNFKINLDPHTVTV